MDRSCVKCLISMAVATARVRPTATVCWSILPLVIRIEREEIVPALEAILSEQATLLQELVEVNRTAESWIPDLDRILRETKTVEQDTKPVWEDNYALCGNPNCEGDCRVCQEGEEDYEEDYTEKYCRRGRR